MTGFEFKELKENKETATGFAEHKRPELVNLTRTYQNRMKSKRRKWKLTLRLLFTAKRKIPFMIYAKVNTNLVEVVPGLQ